MQCNSTDFDLAVVAQLAEHKKINPVRDLNGKKSRWSSWFESNPPPFGMLTANYYIRPCIKQCILKQCDPYSKTCWKKTDV